MFERHEERHKEQTVSSVRSIVICADDFGQSEPINDGIHQLVSAGRLSAVSCLSDGPCFPSGISSLSGAGVDVGLHLNFTDAMGQLGSYFPLKQLIVRSYLGALDAREIERQITRQLDAFEKHANQAPDFVDGHQHVHQLPLIRQKLFSILNKRYSKHRPWIRSTKPRLSVGLPLKQQFKASLIGILGGGALVHEAISQHYQCNRRFLGVYDFSRTGSEYFELLKRWFDLAETGDLLMCHPASGASAGDPLGQQRVREFNVLKSQAFPTLLNEQRIQPARLTLARTPSAASE
uniref:YdjC-like protein n=1 Tax=Dechloromonas aromatica (strain RCB) TaxID=159087 RepID=Q47CE5_DECAR